MASRSRLTVAFIADSEDIQVSTKLSSIKLKTSATSNLPSPIHARKNRPVLKQLTACHGM